jgi:hypothetical protein
MATSINDLRAWLKQGQDKGASHMIVVCDTFDWEDYPVYVMPTQVAEEICEQHKKSNMQKVMEVYNLSKDLESQLNEHRAMEF